MRFLFTISLALAASTASAWALPALPVTFLDQLDSENPADVIGDPDWFDIHSLRFASYNSNTNTLQIDIRFNFGSGSGLNGFVVPGTIPVLDVGDLQFRTATNQYAFILHGHDGLAANGFYKVTGTQTASEALGDPSSFTYRPDAPVWADSQDAVLLGMGGANITTVNGVSTHLLASLLLPISDEVAADFGNGFSFYFAAATCGNDEITGRLAGDTTVPEPTTCLTISAGLIAAALIRRRR